MQVIALHGLIVLRKVRVWARLIMLGQHANNGGLDKI